MPAHGNQIFYIDDRKDLPALEALFDFDQEDEDLEDESSEDELAEGDPDDDDSEEKNEINKAQQAMYFITDCSEFI